MLLLAASGFAAACAAEAPTSVSPPIAVLDSVAVPLTDRPGSSYLGHERGLYEGGARQIPADHEFLGIERARKIRPLGARGVPGPRGRIVLLSVGMSNTSQEFCDPAPLDPLRCRRPSFVSLATADPRVNLASLEFVNGARGGHAVDAWDSARDSVYDWVRDDVLRPRGLSEMQVQVVWLKQANRGSSTRPSLPHAGSDARILLSALGNTVRALHARYPNLQQVYLSSRSYGGYAPASSMLSPEPYAYETGFSVRWLIGAQIRQLRTGMVDPEAGDLGMDAAPWLAWGPYLWANGTVAREDGLAWRREDFRTDGIHPSASGQEKVATLLLSFFRSTTTTRCWFLEGQLC